MGSDGKVKSGVQYDPNGTMAFPYTERVHNYTGTGTVASPLVTGQEGVNAVEQTPLDIAAAKVIQYDLTAIAAAFDSEWIVSPGKTSIPSLPEVLNSVTVTYNKVNGDGQTLYDVADQELVITNRGGGSLNPRASAEGTASILPSVSWDMAPSARNKLVNCVHYYFYLTQESTLAAALVKLTAKAGATVTDLPVFKPKAHQIKVFGQQVSVRADASSTSSLDFSLGDGGVVLSQTAAISSGNGYSKSNGVSEDVKTIPESIHGSITISSATDTSVVTATVEANTKPLYRDATMVNDTIVNEPTPVTATATGSVTPTSLSATTPSSIPITGLYLVDISSESDEKFGFTKIHAVVVDMSQYA